MRVKRERESTAIASSPQQVLHATEKHIIVDHERSQVHLVSSTPSTQLPVLNSYHILNTPGLLGNDPRNLFSAHLLASLQQLAAATNTDGRYQIPLTIQLPSQLYAPTNTIQVSTQPPTSTIQIPQQQILMSHHDLNVLNNMTDTNLNLLQGSQQPPPQSQYETIISRLMRGFIETDTTSDGIPNVDVHLMPHLRTTSSAATVTTTTNSIAKQKEAKPARKYNRAKNSHEKLNDCNSNSNYKSKNNNKRDAAPMIDSTTTNSLITAAKNKRNKSGTVNGTGGNGPIVIPNLAPSYNRSIFNDRGHAISTGFNTTPVKANNENPALTVIPENGKSAKKRKNANVTLTPKKKDKLITNETVDQIQPVSSSSPTQLHPNNNNSRDKVFSCPICKRTFGYKHVLQNHERTHTGEKPFECNICAKKFTRDHHLKTHMRLHTGEKPYQCSHCDRQFVQVANLRRHLRVHTGERPYACEICASKFSDSNQLKAHNLIHKGEKPYNCLECGGKFRRRHHLIHHKCNNNNSGSSPSAFKVEAMTPVLGKGETICTYMVPPALSPPLSSSPVAPTRSIHSGGSSNSSLSSNGRSRTNGSTKRERKSRETRRIIRPEGLPQPTSGISLISMAGRKIMQGGEIMDMELSEEQTQPQDLSFTNSNSITDKFKKLQPSSVMIPQQQSPVLPRHFTGSHSSCSGTSLSSPSPPTSGSHQEDSIFAHCNSEEEPPEFTSASSHNGSSSRSSNCSGDEEHHLSHITPPTSCSSNGGGDHPNLDKGNGELGEEKMDWRFT